jgi:hypothetical protein
MGGVSNDRGQAIVADNLKNVYTTGWYKGTSDFDPRSAGFAILRH